MEDYIVLCDIDGVLANINHRLPYMTMREYDKFYSDEEIAKDSAFTMGCHLLESLQTEHCFRTYLVTGRNEDCRKATEEWLDKHMINYDFLRMRTAGDYRPSMTIKKELVKKIMKENELYEMSYYFLDDDPSNVKRVENIAPLYILGITVGTGLFHKLEVPVGPDDLSALRHAKKLIESAVEPLGRVIEKGVDHGYIPRFHD